MGFHSWKSTTEIKHKWNVWKWLQNRMVVPVYIRGDTLRILFKTTSHTLIHWAFLPFPVWVAGYLTHGKSLFNESNYHIQISRVKRSFFLDITEKKREPKCSPRRAVWSSVTQLSMELQFGATIQGRAVSEQKKRSDLAPLLEGEPFWG